MYAFGICKNVLHYEYDQYNKKKKQQQKTNIYSFLTNPTIKILFLDLINSNLGIYDL